MAVRRTIVFASVTDWVEIQFAATPLAALVADRDPAERWRLLGVVCADVRDALVAFESEGAFAFPQEVNVVLADA